MDQQEALDAVIPFPTDRPPVEETSVGLLRPLGADRPQPTPPERQPRREPSRAPERTLDKGLDREGPSPGILRALE
jgi:hypothetical protein